VLIWGLHPIDLAIVLAFLVGILAVGIAVSRGVKHESDFFLGGRKMGRTLQFFLNFGNATDSNGAVVLASEVFRQGAGGVWLSLQTLFITPFFWFTQPWFRRARVITMADLFVDRFNSKAVASAYAVFNVFVALMLLGVGNRGSYEVTAAMLVKPESAYTVEEAARVNGYRELRALRARVAAGSLPEVERGRFEELENRQKRGQLAGFVSYVRPLPFYVAYSAVVAVYIMMGGLKAAAVTDAIQGLLILVMSIILIPVGLKYVGGFEGLHRRVPEHMMELFGTVAMSEYTWYSIAAITLASLVQIVGLSHNMSSGGSARDEGTARFGMISGGFTKRLVLIAWMFCGLLAVAILSGTLSEPDQAWGALSKALLPTGLMGLMLSGMLLGHMPSVGMSSVALSGLITRNLYEPLLPGRSPGHYLRVGQVVIAVVLGVSVLISMAAGGVASLMKTLITFNTFFGAAVLLLFFWRRLTAKAILISCVIWILLIGIAPIVVPMVEPLRRHPSLLLETTPQTVEVTTGTRTIPAQACFFDKVVRVDPRRPELGSEGIGRFLAENYVLSLAGLPVRRLSPAGLVTARWLFDAIFPFVMLIGFSLLTGRGDAGRAARFYAKMKTPVAPTPELDQAEVEESYARPDRFDGEKLFPRTDWEFTRWTRGDYLGFFGCWGIVGLILLVLIGVLRIGA
jgi:Na+/proline symporter